ncbi:endonuclease/exonuclease/phosphatase family protein [Streptomyces sp. J2-1]|uniref:endonuclease/exonuclease/phosphatase family protein n=1 Tax=Streptomyces corallincola TaxID=2851888 RepID=UPI001C3800C6|nr:endonuclease/exonuclease/phosphatase family protein [Streptomyces corallincola]MBV2357093.1 endonuclease/exonuclease/phosphatase family protein [Streptomyces corallincola]
MKAAGAAVRFGTFNVLHGRRIGPDGRPEPERPAGAPDTKTGTDLGSTPVPGSVPGASVSTGADADGGADAGAGLREAVRSLDVDVLALQELDRLQVRSGGADQAAECAGAARAADWRYASAVHGSYLPDAGWTPSPTHRGLHTLGPDSAASKSRDTGTSQEVPSHGIALLTRLPVRRWHVRRLPPAPVGFPLRVPGRPGLTPVRDQPRTALAAELIGPQGPFTVIATHLSFVPGWNCAQLLALHRWTADMPLPHVLLGDLNLIGAVPATVLNSASLRLPWHTRPAPGPRWRTLARAATYPSHRPLVRFDHILGRGVTVSAEVRAPRAEISDHRPLVAELRL